MTEQPEPARQAMSFGGVADAYDRARPSYPAEAAAWLTGSPGATVLELGAGTGKLTEQLRDSCGTLLATDPSAPMLQRLRARVPGVPAALAAAERIPVRGRAVDVVVSGQAFHWFDPDRTLPEVARVLRPGGRFAAVANHRDGRIPWVRRLGALIGDQERQGDPTEALAASGLFEEPETTTFRFWQPLDRGLLRDLVRSRSNVAVLSETERSQVLARVDALYDEYGRGNDGMLLPYVTSCYRATVRPQRPAPDGPTHGPEDTDSLLIDFS